MLKLLAKLKDKLFPVEPLDDSWDRREQDRGDDNEPLKKLWDAVQRKYPNSAPPNTDVFLADYFQKQRSGSKWPH